MESNEINTNPYEGWLGRGLWVDDGQVVGKGVPPWIDYVFIEGTGCGEMDGTKVRYMIHKFEM